MNISFIPYNKNAQNFIEPPSPSVKNLPEWYKKTKKTKNSEIQGFQHGANNLEINSTIKTCAPFFDAMACGYMWVLPADIEVSIVNNCSYFKWLVEEPLVDTHHPDQAPLLPNLIEGSDGGVYKWVFPFGIKTPSKYSVLFTHPQNRNDLPFRTMSGIVDTDRYHLPIDFPFQIITHEKKFILKRGTPLCQVIPIKRNKWNSVVEKFDDEKTKINMFNFQSTIVRSYKNKFWSKKIYK